MRLSDDEFAALVEEAIRTIPDSFQPYLAHVVVEIEPVPSPRDLETMDLDDAHDLLGLYHGVPLTERSLEDPAHLPDRITIYKENLERICDSREEVVEQVRTTVLHEVGHHFGLDEDDLDELGYQ